MDRISSLVTGGGEGGAVRPTVASMVTSQAPLADIQLFPAVLPQRGVQPVGLGQLLGQRDLGHQKLRPGPAGELVHLRGPADDAAERRDDLAAAEQHARRRPAALVRHHPPLAVLQRPGRVQPVPPGLGLHLVRAGLRSEEHTSELQSPCNLVCRLLLEKKKKNILFIFIIKKKKKIKKSK